jgi:hypothetical protein
MEATMNRRKLLSLVAGGIAVLAALACGEVSQRTTSETSATVTPMATKPGQKLTSIPAATSKPTISKPTDVPKTQIKLEVGSYTNYRDTISTLWFVGEVVNKGDTPAQSVQIALSLLDGSGNVLATGSGRISYVAASGKFPFKIMVDKAPKEWKEVKIQVQGSAYSDKSLFPPYLDLKADKISGQPPASGYGNYGLVGAIVNTGQKTATLVHVVAVAYDNDGKVIDVGETYTQLSEIGAGADAPFKLGFGNIKQAPARYEVFVQGMEKK